MNPIPLDKIARLRRIIALEYLTAPRTARPVISAREETTCTF